VQSQMPRLRSGLGYRQAFRSSVFFHRPRIDFLEIIADHYLDASAEQWAELELLAAHFPIVVHGLDLSIGSAEGVDSRYLEQLAMLIERLNPPWWSEHLCFTRAAGVRIGHLAALPYTHEALDVVARNVETVRRWIRAPLLLENIATVVTIPHGEMDEAEFVSRALSITECGWLCDVANLYANAVNHGPDLNEAFERWPWDRLVEVHYAGGRWKDGVLMDSHDSPTAKPVWALLKRVAARTPICGAILERDAGLPPFEELLLEVEHARTLLQKGD
jgi:uncharacterized protein